MSRCLFDPMGTCYFEQRSILVFMNVLTPVKVGLLLPLQVVIFEESKIGLWHTLQSSKLYL